jgi:hypothetical protein
MGKWKSMNSETTSTNSPQEYSGQAGQAETRSCQNCKKDFTIEPADFDFYKKMDVPPPTWCPECRMMRRMMFWNERYFFKKIEKRTGKEIISMYPPEAPVEIYDRDYWWSDAWSPSSYARDIDWNKPFLAQIHELQLQIPAAARTIVQSINSEYSNNAADLKNCYLTFDAGRSEDCMYAVGIESIKNSISVFRAEASEMIFECYAVFNSYQCYFSSILLDCRNVWFSNDCHNCSDCFGCVNLRSKKYCIFNEQYTKEEYERKIKELDLGSYAAIEKLEKQLQERYLRFPRRYIHGARNVNVSGDGMRNSKNTHYSFALNQCEDVKYSQSILRGAKDSYDYTNWGNNVELTCETISCGANVQRVKFSYGCFGGATDIEYSMDCTGSSNLFGCVGLHSKKYCILNKQYSKEEYEALVPRIKAHMKEVPYVDKLGRVYKYGEFFPMEFSPFAADETALPDFMEIDKATAEKYGLIWRDRKPTEFKITRPAKDLPDRISEVTDSITADIIGCIQCGRGYRIPATELQFLKNLNLPLSRFCPTCRVRRLVLHRNYPKWYPGSCQCAGEKSANGVYVNVGRHTHGGDPCGETFISSYAPSRPEIVYCESCYNAEVV